MPVDKAFERSLEKHFGKMTPLFYEQKNTLANIRYDYYSGYEAGQKSLSPEVREAIDALKMALHLLRDRPNIAETYINSAIKNLLAKE